MSLHRIEHNLHKLCQSLSKVSLSDLCALKTNATAEGFQEFRGDLTGLAVANLAGVNLDDRDDLGSCSSKEKFVRHPDVVARHVGLSPRDTNFVSNLQCGIAGDTLEGTSTSGWRDELTFMNNEDIVPSTFGDVTLVVEHYRLVIAEVLRFDLCKNIVQIIQ